MRINESPCSRMTSATCSKMTSNSVSCKRCTNMANSPSVNLCTGSCVEHQHMQVRNQVMMTSIWSPCLTRTAPPGNNDTWQHLLSPPNQCCLCSIGLPRWCGPAMFDRTAKTRAHICICRDSDNGNNTICGFQHRFTFASASASAGH